MHLVNDVTEHDSFFVQKCECSGKLELSNIQKCLAAIKILGYGITLDTMDQYVCISESTTRDSMKHFVKAIHEVYEATYLKKPTQEDLLQQMEINRHRGWP